MDCTRPPLGSEVQFFKSEKFELLDLAAKVEDAVSAAGRKA